MIMVYQKYNIIFKIQVIEKWKITPNISDFSKEYEIDRHTLRNFIPYEESIRSTRQEKYRTSSSKK